MKSTGRLCCNEAHHIWAVLGDKSFKTILESCLGGSCGLPNQEKERHQPVSLNPN